MDGSKFNDNQNLAYFDSWVKNKAQNGVFNLKQLVDNIFPLPKASEVVAPGVAKTWVLLT